MSTSRPTRPVSRQLRIEPLEARRLLAVFTVTNLNDAGDGSLRQAILDANDNPQHDEIEFDPAVIGTIHLTSGELAITDSLTIDGPGPDVATIDAKGQSRVFNIDDGTSSFLDVEIGGLTITGGREFARGGGILSRENLSVTNSTISGNAVSGIGGGIYAVGDVTVTNSTISGNGSESDGGGVFSPGNGSVTNSTISGNVSGRGYGGGIFAVGDVTVTDSTISGNTGTAGGGGIQASSVAVTNSTVSDNNGGGISVDTVEGASAVTVTGSILSGNTLAGVLPEDVTIRGSFQFTGNHSLLGLAAAALVTTGSDNISDDNPQLAPLADNGGSTETQALLRGSPAIDAGDPDAVAGENDVPHFDQRGAPFARVVNDRIDIGAYEHSPSTPPADLTGDGFVDFDDLTILLAHWDQRVSAALGNLVDPLTTPVNFQDLTLLLADWTGPGPVGAASPQAVVVEDELSSSDEPQHVDDFVSTSRPPPPAARRSSQRDPSPLRRLQAIDRAMADYQADRVRHAEHDLRLRRQPFLPGGDVRAQLLTGQTL